MAIQPIGNAPPAMPPQGGGEFAQLRTNAQSAAPQVETQTSQAVSQASSDRAHLSLQKDDLNRAVKKINEFVQTSASDVQFSVDEGTGIRVVKVVDRATKDVIRQIPSEEVLKIANALDQLQGLLIRQQA